MVPKNAIIVNKKAFDALDKPTQQAVLKAAAAAETSGWKSSEEKNGASHRYLAFRALAADLRGLLAT